MSEPFLHDTATLMLSTPTSIDLKNSPIMSSINCNHKKFRINVPLAIRVSPHHDTADSLEACTKLCRAANLLSTVHPSSSRRMCYGATNLFTEVNPLLPIRS
jgi:hypothetical protein